VAAVHEYGSRPIAVKLTPKARAFLHATFRNDGLDSPARDKPSTGIANQGARAAVLRAYPLESLDGRLAALRAWRDLVLGV
jgi:hypothetical protein